MRATRCSALEPTSGPSSPRRSSHAVLGSRHAVVSDQLEPQIPLADRAVRGRGRWRRGRLQLLSPFRTPPLGVIGPRLRLTYSQWGISRHPPPGDALAERPERAHTTLTEHATA